MGCTAHDLVCAAAERGLNRLSRAQHVASHSASLAWATAELTAAAGRAKQSLWSLTE